MYFWIRKQQKKNQALNKSGLHMYVLIEVFCSPYRKEQWHFVSIMKRMMAEMRIKLRNYDAWSTVLSLTATACIPQTNAAVRTWSRRKVPGLVVRKPTCDLGNYLTWSLNFLQCQIEKIYFPCLPYRLALRLKENSDLQCKCEALLCLYCILLGFLL